MESLPKGKAKANQHFYCNLGNEYITLADGRGTLLLRFQHHLLLYRTLLTISGPMRNDKNRSTREGRLGGVRVDDCVSNYEDVKITNWD